MLLIAALVCLGAVLTIGMAVDSNVLIFERSREEMRAGKSRLEAIMEAGHKRARPIIMTTVAMVAGMLPVAIGWGGDSDFRGPMAIAVIGGLITSTMLTLVIVPAVFTLFDDIERWAAPKASALLAGSSTPALGRDAPALTGTPALPSDRTKLGPPKNNPEPAT